MIYAPTRQRRKRKSLEVYHLVDGEYILQSGDVVWMPDVGLGIGRERGTYQGLTREWLYWYDKNGNRYLTPEEQLQTLLARLQQSRIYPNTL